MTTYFEHIAAAYVRGKLGPSVPEMLSSTVLSELTGTDLEVILEAGRNAGLRLHRFKRTMGLARVERVLGVLRGTRLPRDTVPVCLRSQPLPVLPHARARPHVPRL